MDATAFHAPAAGRVITVPTGYMAFVPAPLPPQLRYDQRLALAQSKADAALSELSGLGAHLPNPHLLIAPYIRREAVLSSRIEGTRATISDLFLREATAEAPTQPDVTEVANYVGALQYGLQRLTSLPLSLRLVREIHERLMHGARGEHGTPGEFRRSQNWIGPAGSNPETAPYVPPPPAEMMDLLGDWERFLHQRDTMPDLIQCAIMHEQFEAIHPFIDGNGRVGRLLVTLFLMERGRLSQPLLYLSAFIEAHRQDYYDLLQAVRTDGDWEAWVHFFLQGVRETAEDASRQARQLMDLREAFRAHLLRKAKALELVDYLFINPFITVSRAANLLGSSTETARQAVMALEDSEILQETTGRSWGRLYVARPIYDVLQTPGVGRRDAETRE